MNIKPYPVHPALKEFVETIFQACTNPNQEEEILQTSLPTYECFIGFEYDTDFLVKNIKASEFIPIHKATIIPPQLDITLMRGKSMKAVMVKFKQGGFFRLFKIPFTEFNNECHNARTVLGKSFAILHESILNAENVDLKVRLVEAFLLKKAASSSSSMPIDRIIDHIFINNGNIPIMDLASNACMSIRQLQRKFLEQFGLSPKHYSRLIRFNNAHRMKILSPDLTWGEISIRCGYFDQMHMIRDFKSIAALNPCQLDTKASQSHLLTLSSGAASCNNLIL